MWATKVGPTTKNLKKCHLLKRPKAVPYKTKLGPKYKWFKILYCYSFLENIVNIISGNFFIFSTRSSGHQQRVFFNFRFSSRKSQSQQKLTKKVTYFTIQFHSNNLTHFTKRYLHYTISWLPRTALLKHFESKSLYISVYHCKNILSGAGKPNNFLNEAGCLGLLTYLAIFLVNWNFWELNYLLESRYLHL